MNIFILDENPEIAARSLVQCHLAKMTTEGAQILATAFSTEILSNPQCPKTKSGTSWKHSHFNHPCCKWCRESRANMLWLIEHCFAADNERVERNNTPPSHVVNFLNWCLENINQSIAPNIPLTKFALAMPDIYHRDNPVEAYRLYYKFGKKHLHSWKRNRPLWIDSENVI